MADSLDRLGTRPDPDGVDAERFSADEMEEYGEWLKSDSQAPVDYSRLSSEEENLLGSFSLGSERIIASSDELRTAPGNISSADIPGISHPISWSHRHASGHDNAGNDVSNDGIIEESESVDGFDLNSDSLLDEGLDAEEMLPSWGFGDSEAKYDEKEALDDAFVLGSAALAGDPERQSERAPEFTSVDTDDENQTDLSEDEISEEFFEIDEELSEQNESEVLGESGEATAASGTETQSQVSGHDTAINGEESTGAVSLTVRSGKKEVTAGSDNDILARIAHELSSIRGELVGIKEGFTCGHKEEELASIPTAAIQEAETDTTPVLPALAVDSCAEINASDKETHIIQSGRPSATGTSDHQESIESDASPEAIASRETMPLRDLRMSTEFVEELRRMFIYMDGLLESLPDSKIEEFARSPHFDSYKHIFEILGIA